MKVCHKDSLLEILIILVVDCYWVWGRARKMFKSLSLTKVGNCETNMLKMDLVSVIFWHRFWGSCPEILDSGAIFWTHGVQEYYWKRCRKKSSIFFPKNHPIAGFCHSCMEVTGRPSPKGWSRKRKGCAPEQSSGWISSATEIRSTQKKNKVVTGIYMDLQRWN